MIAVWGEHARRGYLRVGEQGRAGARLAPDVLHLPGVPGAAGRPDLLLQGQEAVLRPPPRRDNQTEVLGL